MSTNDDRYNLAAEPEPPKSCAVDPIPLSERKPGPEDRDHYGQCWWWGTSCTHRPAWVYASGWGTHWLPASIKCLPARVEGSGDAEIAAPVPPVEGEVAELVAWLRCHASSKLRIQREQFLRAADLLERLAPQPVPEGPADDDIEALHQAVFASRLHGPPPNTSCEVDLVCAALARWSQS